MDKPTLHAEDKTEFDVVLPKSLDFPGISSGSAIIAVPDSNGMVKLDYEGNLYNAENLQRFEDKCLIAAGRSKDHYPTVARRYISDEELKEKFIVIGQFDIVGRGLIMDLQYMRLLKEWDQASDTVSEDQEKAVQADSKPRGMAP